MIRVLVADDQALVRGAIITLLGLEPDLEVVAEAGRGDEVLELVRLHRADVALLDVDNLTQLNAPLTTAPATSSYAR